MKCTKCLICSETPRGSYVKHLVSLMECSGRCSGSFWQVGQVLVGSCVLHLKSLTRCFTSTISALVKYLWLYVHFSRLCLSKHTRCSTQLPTRTYQISQKLPLHLLESSMNFLIVIILIIMGI